MARRASVLAVFKCGSCEDTLVVAEEVARAMRSKSRGLDVEGRHLNDGGEAGCHYPLSRVQFSYM